MLAVSQASPRPKTEFVACSEMPASKFCPMSMSQHEDLEPGAPEQRDGFYYLRLAAQVEAKFRERMQLFEAALDSEAGLSEEGESLTSFISCKTTRQEPRKQTSIFLTA